MTTINMNDRVAVRLTAAGLIILDAFEETVGIPVRHRRLSVSDGNLWKGQLWELMQDFGPCVSLGMIDMPFVANRIDVESNEAPMVARSEPGGYAEPTIRRDRDKP